MTTAIAPPEPDLTATELIARAIELRPRLIADQAATEARTFYSQEMHEAFVDAGFYRMYVPRRYGGYEVDVPTFMRVIQEIARGCPSTAWCLALASSHALQVASWFPEEAQAEIFGDGDFRAAAVATPVGPAAPVDGGWELNGKVSYCSGIPYSTHYMGQALLPADAPGGPPRMLLFVAPRDGWTRLDDWGNTLGLKGSGSHSIVFDGAHIPAHWALEDTMMLDVDPSGGTIGSRLHGNPMYGGRALGVFTMTLAAPLIGAAYGALDVYEELLHTSRITVPPFTPRYLDHDYQRWFGGAMAHLAVAETVLEGAAQRYMELARRNVEDGIPFTYGDDALLNTLAREAYMIAWRTLEGEIFRTAGSSAAKDGERIQRIFRDMAMGSGHRNTLLQDWTFREVAREHLGLPRDGSPPDPD